MLHLAWGVWHRRLRSEVKVCFSSLSIPSGECARNDIPSVLISGYLLFGNFLSFLSRIFVKWQISFRKFLTPGIADRERR